MVKGLIVFILFGFFLFLYSYATYNWGKNKDAKISNEIAYQGIVEEEKRKKGTAFEVQIAQLISSKLKGAIVINNCILNKKSKDGKDIYWEGTVASKEFDVICLSRKGLFVIEAKNYAQAFVSGNFNDKTWITSYSKNKVYNVYSPFKQVTEAIITLKRYLPDFNFEKFVVFPDSTKISDNLKKTGKVLNLSEFDYLLDNMNERVDLIEAESIRLVKDLLVEENDRARAMNAEYEHLEYVKKCKEKTALA